MAEALIGVFDGHIIDDADDVHLNERCLPHCCQLLTGPKHIEIGWWDDNDMARDYFVAEDIQGSRVWLFRELRTSLQWFLHGVFG